MRNRPHFLRAVFILCLTLFSAGCTTQQQYAELHRLTDLPARAELLDTPFFPDDSYFCGPSALATSLSAAGISVRPEILVPEVFVPGRKGSLQIEMLASARRHGAVAIIIPGSMESLLREVSAGHPVLVLQNLGLSWAPSWHYAVVVGYDLNANHLVLRSGSMKRQELSIRTFEYTWNRSERWAFVTLQPGKLPVTAREEEVTRALVAFERSASFKNAERAYRSGLAKWPDNATLAMGLGNVLYASGNYRASEKIFRQVAQKHDLPAAYNNHAYVLMKLGRYAEARQAVKRGLALGEVMRPALLKTQEAIEAAASR